MAMSRKDYTAFAAIIAGEISLAAHANDSHAVLALTNLTRSMADVMKRDNTSFNRDRFYVAAGIA